MPPPPPPDDLQKRAFKRETFTVYLQNATFEHGSVSKARIRTKQQKAHIPLIWKCDYKKTDHLPADPI